ncbi:Na-translocating system protein MpsC family protein, partial [Priestia megaterium]|uniref:Na-translocating system protein MpsC family protein n=1 Tax=Priestia megaterium TaxID=1404 RepID=UPI002FFF4323
MSKTIHEFNDIIRKLRKDLFGKGPERIHISTLYGNLTPTETFIASTSEGCDMVHLARTKMIQDVY